MQRVTTTQARQELSELINEVSYAKEHIILTRRGKDLGAIVPIEALLLIQQAIEDEEDRLDREAIKQAWKNQGDDPLIPWEDVKKEFNIE